MSKIGHNWLAIPEYQYTRIVAKGGDSKYKTIQSAINSIPNDGNDWVIIVNNGIYEENITIWGGVTLFGYSRTNGVVIKGTVTINASYGNSRTAGFRNIGFQLTNPAANTALFDCATTTNYALADCRITVTGTDTNAYIGKHSGTGRVRVDRSLISYNITGTAVSAKTHILFDIRGTSWCELLNNEITCSIADANDNVHLVDNSSSDITNINLIRSNRTYYNLTSATYSGSVMLLFTDKKDVVLEIGYNTIEFISSGDGTAYLVYVDAGTGAVVRCFCNHVEMLGFANEYYAFIQTGDTVIAHFEDVTNSTSLGSTGGGTFKYVYSPVDGQLRLSETLHVKEGVHINNTSAALNPEIQLIGQSIDVFDNEGGIYLSKTSANAYQLDNDNGTLITFDSDRTASIYGRFATLGGRKIKVNSITSSAGTTVLTTADHFVCVTGTTTHTLTLPASSDGIVLVIKNRSTGLVTINRAGSDTIDGGTSVVLTNNQSVTLIANGTDWTIN